MSRTTCFAGLLLVVACQRPEPPTLRPASATVTAVTPAGMTVRVVLDAYNPNDFGLAARGVTAKVVLAKSATLGPIRSASAVALPSRQWVKLQTDVTATWEGAASVAALAASAPVIPYEVHGSVTVGGESVSLDVPFTLRGEVRREELLAAGMRGLGLPALAP